MPGEVDEMRRPNLRQESSDAIRVQQVNLIPVDARGRINHRAFQSGRMKLPPVFRKRRQALATEESSGACHEHPVHCWQAKKARYLAMTDCCVGAAPSVITL